MTFDKDGSASSHVFALCLYPLRLLPQCSMKGSESCCPHRTCHSASLQIYAETRATAEEKTHQFLSLMDFLQRVAHHLSTIPHKEDSMIKDYLKTICFLVVVLAATSCSQNYPAASQP